ncbi:MAG: cytochrome b [Paracoccaceae bacterium]
MSDTPNPSYSLASRLTHWAVAALVIGLLIVGFTLKFADLPRETKMALMGPHKALGVLALALGLWRLGLRRAEGFPAPAAGVGRREARMASLAHRAMIVLLVLIPLVGVVASLAHGRAIDMFGLFTIPSFGEVSWLASAAGALHGPLSLALAVLIVLHLGAALKHHFVDRDATLRRMTRPTA